MGSEKTALVVGAGDFLGAAIARRFAKEGYHVVATRRRGDLKALVSTIEAMGGSATGIHSDARDEQAVSDLVSHIENDVGPIDIVIFNVGGNVRFGITETTARVYGKVWELCAFAGFLVGREAAKVMLPRDQARSFLPGPQPVFVGLTAMQPLPAASMRFALLLRAWHESLDQRASMSAMW